MPVKIKGTRIIYRQGASAPKAAVQNAAPGQAARNPCSRCGKDRAEHPKMAQRGSNHGNSITLAKHIFEGKQKEDHPWYAGNFSLQAHHIICSESMDNDFWHQGCWDFGYDINHRNNGVMLPSKLRLACQLRAPLHRGNHFAGEAGPLDLSYPDGVKQKLFPIQQRILAGKYCQKPESLRRTLDNLSREILTNIDSFEWTLTEDGSDYQHGGAGCRGEVSLGAKRKVIASSADAACPTGRLHGVKHAIKQTLLFPRATSLQVGE